MLEMAEGIPDTFPAPATRSAMRRIGLMTSAANSE